VFGVLTQLIEFRSWTTSFDNFVRPMHYSPRADLHRFLHLVAQERSELGNI